MDPVGSLIGLIFMGLGTVIIYGAIKNRKVFGESGIIPTALTTGDLSDLSKIPEAYPTLNLASGASGSVGKLVSAKWLLPVAVQSAIANISDVDETLGNNIADAMNSIDSDSTHQDVMPLGQLLAIADGKGKKTDADAIRSYIRNLTGESI